MSKGRILVVEDDLDVSNMLQLYFDSQGYEVTVATRGKEALEISRTKMPEVVVLDINLPDLNGYEVCRELRSNLRTSHIPIIFLTQKDERSDKIAGLELGADDYITKPFDIEELRLRVQNALRRVRHESLTSPTTGLPSGKLIEEQLKLLMRKSNWAILYIGLNNMKPFNDVYGFVAGDDVLRFAAMLISEALNELGSPNDFLGHIGGGDFIVITTPDKSEDLRDRIVKRFNSEVVAFYSFKDRERGYMVISDAEGERHASLMTMSVGIVTDKTAEFSDIREITEVAARVRRESALRGQD